MDDLDQIALEGRLTAIELVLGKLLSQQGAGTKDHLYQEVKTASAPTPASAGLTGVYREALEDTISRIFKKMA